jgi:hypothetical protein
VTDISDGSTTITPAVVDGYKASRPGRNVTHIILNREDDDVSLMPAGLREGKLTAVFQSRSDAFTLVGMLAAVGSFTILDDTVTDVGMTFVLEGQATIELDDKTRNTWLVEFGFKEVAT